MAVVYELIVVPVFWFVIFPGIVIYDESVENPINIDDE